MPCFLSQLSQTLLAEVDGPTPAGACDVAIDESSARHGAELLALGFTVSQVVHVCGAICQAVTEIAIAQKAAVSVEEFHILNRSLDAAIAGALTEHAKLDCLGPIHATRSVLSYVSIAPDQNGCAPKFPRGG